MTAPGSLVHPYQMAAVLELAAGTPPGTFVEVGVWRGGSAFALAELAREQGRALHLFDTFTGTPYADPDDNHPVGDFADTSFDDVFAAISDAVFHVGIFPDTWSGDASPVAFAHIDCDQYRSVKACIETIWPVVVRGGAMMFDDYGCTRGATRAVDEAFGDHIAFTPMGRAYIGKPV